MSQNIKEQLSAENDSGDESERHLQTPNSQPLIVKSANPSDMYLAAVEAPELTIANNCQKPDHLRYAENKNENQRNQYGFVVSEPLDLMPKNVKLVDEQIKTGAPIGFLCLERFHVGRKVELEKLAQSNGSAASLSAPVAIPGSTDEVQTIRDSSTILPKYMVAMFDINKVVYCRYGRDYIPSVAKQIQMAIQNPTLCQPVRQIATYLINIKKLVLEHNIESDEKDFTKLRTKGKIGNIILPPSQYYIPESAKDPTLIFESRFESGNLLVAIMVGENEYDLVLQNDINTNGHTQWYFFRVGNTRKGHKVRFNIINLAKPDSLYNQGMRVLSYSNNLQKQQDCGWHRVGSDIRYYQNNLKNQVNPRYPNKRYFTLTFTHTFESDDDQVYFTHCFPYTYSDLCEDLQQIENKPNS